jgi:hypothetical protein
MHYPEVLFIDSTHGTNNESHPLLNILGKIAMVKPSFTLIRNGLLAAIQEMEQEETFSSNEQSSLLKIIMCFSLLVYMCGGSEFYLVVAVGFILFADLINAC